MSSICSQGMVLATAMAAVSGTVILLALRLQKTQFPLVDPIIPGGHSSRPQSLRPCISLEGKKKSKKKRVHFAEDVVDPRGDGEEFRKQHDVVAIVKNSRKVKKIVSVERKPSSGGGGGKIPANRLALYNGILRDRVVHRLACSY